MTMFEQFDLNQDETVEEEKTSSEEFIEKSDVIQETEPDTEKREVLEDSQEVGENEEKVKDSSIFDEFINAKHEPIVLPEEKNQEPSEPLRTIMPFSSKNVVLPEDESRLDKLDLFESMRAKKPIEGIVQSIEYVHDSENKMGINLVLYYGRTSMPIKIPVEEFFDNIPTEPVERYRGSEEMQTPHQWCDRRAKSFLLAPIDYIVQKFDEETGNVYASRLKAMDAKVKRYYFGRREYERIEENCIVMARVLSVRMNYLIVDVAGVETNINPRELGYQFIPDLREAYRIGDCFNVKVMKLELDTENKTVKRLEVSKREAETDDRDQKMLPFARETVHIGYAVFVDENGTVVSFYNSSRMNRSAKNWIFDCRCSFSKNPNIPRPAVGDKVFVKITKVDQENKKLYGEIIRREIIDD